jgi:hypothetical protein
MLKVHFIISSYIQYNIHIQYPYIVGNYKINLNELKKQVEKGAFDELLYSVLQRVQIMIGPVKMLWGAI